MTITIVDVETRDGWVYLTDTAEVKVGRNPYLPLLESTGGYTRHLFAPGSTVGPGESAADPIRIANTDRQLNRLHRTVDGRRIIVRQAVPDSEGRPPEDPAAYTTTFEGLIEVADFVGDSVDLIILNRQTAIAEGLVTDRRFDGTATAGGAGLGGAAELAGNPHPILIGHAYNFEPSVANPFDLIYMVSQGWPGHSVVFHFLKDRGISITPGTQHATLAGLRAVAEAGTVPDSEYDWYTGDDGTFFALGSEPDGVVTVEATEGGGRTVAEVAELLLLRSPLLSEGDIRGVSAMNASVPGESGIYIPAEDRAIGSCLEELLLGLGSWHDALDGTGVVLIPWDLPTSAVQHIDEWECLEDIDLLSTNDEGGGAPIKEMLIGFRRNYLPLSKSDLDETAAVADAIALSQEWLVTDPAIVAGAVSRNPLARTMRLNTSLRYRADAERIRDRHRDSRANGVDLFRVQLPTLRTRAAVGQGVTISNAQFGLDVSLCGVLGRSTTGRTVDDIPITDLIIWRPSP